MTSYPDCLPTGLDKTQLKTIERSLSGIDYRYRFNTVFINSLDTYTSSSFTIDNFCPRTTALTNILNSNTYKYNNVIGYNKITNIAGSNNTFIGTNESLNDISTNNTITLGYNILPESNTIQLKPNKDGGVFKIYPPTTNSVYYFTQLNNNYILHDNYNQVAINTSAVTQNFNLSATESVLYMNTGNVILTGGSVAFGRTARSYQSNMLSFSNFNFSDNKSVMKASFMLQGITSGSTLTQIFCDNLSTPITLPNNTVWSGIINVIGYGVSDNDVARYTRQVTVRRINNNTTLENESVVGSDIEQSYDVGINNDLSITASGGSLIIRVKGCNGDWKWSAYADGLLMYI